MTKIKPLPQLGKTQKGGGVLDKLAQPKQTQQGQRIEKGVLFKKARRKYATQHLTIQLVNTGSEMNYWGAFHCCNTMSKEGNKVTSMYCNLRWCQTCNAIRTAKAINGYLPQIEAMENPIFLTLTRPNVKEAELEAELDIMKRRFKEQRRRFKRTEGIDLKGVWKFEVLYKYHRNDYNQHIHCVLEGGKDWDNLGEKVVSSWLSMNPSCNRKGQDFRLITKEEGSAKEIFKYFTKIVTKINQENGDTTYIHAKSLDVIFKAMKGRRAYQPFGGLRMVKAEVEDLQAEELSPEIIDNKTDGEYIFDTSQGDWISEDGECLTGYEPSEGIKRIFDAKNLVKNLVNAMKIVSDRHEAKLEEKRKKARQWKEAIEGIRNEFRNEFREEHYEPN